MFTDFDKRMKAWESLTKNYLPKELPIIIRIDGKKFSKYTKGLEKPFCKELNSLFENTILTLIKEVQGAKLVYHQSDEISILLYAGEKEESELYYGGNLQKLTSVTASLTTGYFNLLKPDFLPNHNKTCAFFDSRAFTLSKEEVSNYFYWRWQDCQRNAVAGTYRWNLGHKKAHGLVKTEMEEEIKEKGIIIDNIHLDGTFYFIEEDSGHKTFIPTQTNLFTNREILDNYLESILF